MQKLSPLSSPLGPAMSKTKKIPDPNWNCHTQEQPGFWPFCQPLTLATSVMLRSGSKFYKIHI